MVSKQSKKGNITWHNTEKCPECPKVCASFSHLQKHIDAKHPYLNPHTYERWQCGIVGCEEDAPFGWDLKHYCKVHIEEVSGFELDKNNKFKFNKSNGDE